MLGQHTDLGDFTVSKGEPSSFRYHQASSLTLVHDRCDLQMAQQSLCAGYPIFV